MAFAENHGVRIWWREQGSGSPILLVMGHRYSSAMWYPILTQLAAAHRVISFDNRGAGQSDATPHLTMGEMAADAIAVMDAAKVERAHVFGVSMGGVIAIELALSQPQRVKSLIVGCSGILTADKPRAPAALRILYYLPPRVLGWLAGGGRGDRGYGSAAPRERIAIDQAMLAKDRSNARGLIAQAAAVASYSTTREAVAKLTLPALVLHGDEDALVPFGWGVELAETLANSRFVRLKGAGHNFLVAAGETSSQAVLDFLSEIDHDGAAAS